MNKLSVLTSLFYKLTMEEKKRLAIIEQKERNNLELWKVLGTENGDRIYDIIKSEKNIYGVDEETRRTADIVRIVSSGIDFNQIKEWVERGDEGMIAYLITQCGYELLTIFRGQEK